MDIRSSCSKPAQLIMVVLFASIIPLCQLSAQSKPWLVPKEYINLNNPMADNQAAIKEGRTLYTANCAPCHGGKGKGDGPAAAALNPKPADHSSIIMLRETDGDIFYKISEGRTPMPQYKSAFTEKQRWELVAYIRTLSKGSKH
ncbi:MAG: c-type cytochrome [Sediminibacterium magnilacihabitans]|nr:c-type cytochrome [Sediminibacterium magnilacihabitans]PQV60295.1 cbb3-type cytochrome c oxidase subunit III [Sediminibacterium magnilacihabitans]